MPQLGLGTEIGRVSGGAYDSDALAYFARAGIASGTQTPTAYDNAASFNGTNQFLSVADNASINLSGTNFTLSCWYFVSALNTANAYVFGKAVLNLLPLDYGFRINANTTTTQFLWSTSGSYSVLTGPSVVLGAWNHLTIVFDGTNLTMYGNGVAGTPVAMPAAIQNTANPLSIGLAGANNSQYLNGRVAAFGLWKRALTASEVTALWNNGAGRTYASLDSGLRNNLISWWVLNQNSVTADSHGTNTLTNNGTVTAPNIGPIITGYSDSRRLISDFVRGIKSLGLWNSMVCWPLRGSQNVGSGLTARSLGGLGTFDGILAGGTLPSWTANGLSLAASSQMNASVTTVPQNVTLLFAAAGDGGAQTGSAQYFGLQRADTWSGNQFALGCENNPPSLISANQRNSIISSNFTLQTPANPFLNSSIFNFVSGSLSQTSPILNYRNLNTGITTTGTVNTTGTNTLNRVQLNGRWDGSLAIGTPHTAAFCGYITPASDSQVSAIYSLYRQTLGIGLKLP